MVSSLVDTPYYPRQPNSKRNDDGLILLCSSPSEEDFAAFEEFLGDQLEPSRKIFSEIWKNLFDLSGALGETWLDYAQFGFPTPTTPPRVLTRFTIPLERPSKDSCSPAGTGCGVDGA